MGRSLKYEIPGTDWRRSTLELADLGFDGLFGPEFSAPQERVLEIGFGRGEFLLELAAKNPESAFLGVEVSFKRVLKMARKVGRSGLSNIRVMEARGEVVLGDLIPSDCLDAIWVNFSDPWPKDRHAGRRFIRPEVVADVARSLVRGGLVQVATDDVPYAHQISEVLAGESRLRNVHEPLPWLADVPGRIPTGYEIEWRAAGRPLHFFTYERIPAQAGGELK